MKKFKLIASILFLFTLTAQASLSVDRTRVIFEEEKPGVSIVVENTDLKDPYLLQTWIENAQGEKINEPLIALPLLQRIEAGKKKQIQINTSTQKTQLSTTQETLFYFNILGIPPKSKLENVVEIVIQSRFKLFYRPKGLTIYPETDWQKELKLDIKGNSLILNNPTPYHIVVIDINNDTKKSSDFQEIIVKPNNNSIYSLTEKQKKASQLFVTYIDDYGTPHSLKYSCQGISCTLLQNN